MKAETKRQLAHGAIAGVASAVPVYLVFRFVELSFWWAALVAFLICGASRFATIFVASRFFDLAPVIMAALVAAFPPKDDPAEWDRYARVAVAADRAVTEQVERGWHGTTNELVAATITAIRFEAGPMDIDVHSGANSRNGFCLGQIHHTNGFWKDYAASLQELVGTDVEATYRCLRTVTRTLASARAYCLKKPHRFKRNWREAMWSIYGTGHKCWLSRTALRRSRFQREIESKAFVPDERIIQLVEAARGST